MSKPINELLNFDFKAEVFDQKAKSAFTNDLKKQQEKNIKILNQLTEKLGDADFTQKPTFGIEDVYLKTTTLLQNEEDLKGKFDKRELRTLTYALDFKLNSKTTILAEISYLQQCIQLLNNNWNDRFIFGLLHCYLKNWNFRKKPSIELLSKFVIEKINNYDGKRDKYLNLKNQTKFFDYTKGDIDLGYTLALLKKPIHQANKHINLPDTWLAYPYFYGVINAFLEKTKNEVKTHFNDLVTVLGKHSNQTKEMEHNKIILSKIICYSKDIEDDHYNNQLKDVAFKLVGDPGDAQIWSVGNALEKDKTTVEQARKILNEWLTKQFINVFFEKCINDERRKVFWLQYSKHISDFKVIGPKTLKYILEQDDRIGKYVDSRFSVTSSSKDVSVMVMYINNHVLLEFSNDGYAFIGYKKDNPIIKKFDKAIRIRQVDDLRDSDLPMALKTKGEDVLDHNSEGRLFHKDGTFYWEDKFDWWLKKYVL